MSRPLRLELPGATYHVYARGNRRAAVFGSTAEYDEYIRDLAKLSREHGIAVLAFCLMPNHTHLCLKTTAQGDPLHVLMHRLNLRHSRRFNLAHRVSGRLYESRYQAQFVDSARYLLTLVRYIHQNPVEAGLAPSADGWAFTSHHAYRRQGFPFVATQHVRRLLRGTGEYERLMGQPLETEERNLFDPGGEHLVVPQGPQHQPPRIRRGPWHTPPPPVPVEAKAAVWALARGIALPAFHGAKLTEDALVLREQLAVDLRASGYRLNDIGAVIGRDASIVSRLLARARRSAREDPQARKCQVDAEDAASTVHVQTRHRPLL